MATYSDHQAKSSALQKKAASATLPIRQGNITQSKLGTLGTLFPALPGGRCVSRLFKDPTRRQ
jgi:hypothetical protein